jgi:hypothetical protein
MQDSIVRSPRSGQVFVMLTLLLSAVSFGYLLYATYVGYRPVQEFPQWHGALPITTDRATAVGFFRRQFSLPSEPVKAYLLISGTDQFSVYVNGNLAGISRYFGTRVSESMDITRFVRSGGNLLAVAVESNAPHSHCELTARLELRMPDGSRKTILTDPDWRAVTVEESVSSRQAAWYESNFSDLHWPPARISEPPDPRPIHPYAVPELILQSFPDGYWLGTRSGDGRDTTFVRDFQVGPQRITGAWLGVSAAGNYTIVMNDQFLYSYAGSRRSMELFDIEPYVKQGSNRLSIEVEGETSLAKLAVSGLVLSAAAQIDFSSDGRWRTLETERIAQASSAYGTVLVLQPLGHATPNSSMTLNFNQIETPIGRIVDYGVRFGIIAVMLFIAFASGVVLLHLLTRRYDPIPLWQDLETLVSPLLLGALLSLGLIIVSFDVRVDAQALFRPHFVIGIGLIVLLWEGFIMLERLTRRRSSDA